MAQETIFSKIIRKEIPANIVYQDELVTAFRDISPQAKTHILIIPNKVIPTVNDVTEQDEVTLGRLFTVAAKIAKEEGYEQIAELFDITANNEKEHAKLWFKALHGDTIPDTLTNLADAAAGENYEWTDMYAKFAEEAREESPRKGIY